MVLWPFGEGRIDSTPWLVEASARVGRGPRWLVTSLHKSCELLEEGEQTGVGNPFPFALASDESRELNRWMEAYMGSRPADRQLAAGWGRWRAWRVSEAGEARRARAMLAGTQVRTWEAIRPGQRVAVASLAQDHLVLSPIHRGIRGLATFDPDRFLTLLREYAQEYRLPGTLRDERGRAEALRSLGALGSEGRHAVLLALPEGGARLLRFRQALDLVHLRAGLPSPSLRSVDLALLNTLVLRTVLGLDAPNNAAHPNIVFDEDADALLRGVDEGRLQAAFLLNPPLRWELQAVLAAGAPLPARTVRMRPDVPAELLDRAPQDAAELGSAF